MLKSYLKKRAIILLLIVGYATLLFLRSLGLNIWTPSCPISAYTKYECLGCGLNRAAMSLMQLDFERAWAFNPLIFLYVPLTFGLLFFDFYKYSTKFKSEN